MAIRINHKDNSLQFNKVAAPLVNPPAGTVALYFDSTGNLAFKDEAGTESEITSTASNFIGYFNEVAKIQATTDGVKAVGLLELTGYATGSLPTGVNGAVVYDTTTNTLKFYNGSIWADSVLKTGDTMTGDLTIAKSNPTVALNRTAEDQSAHFLLGSFSDGWAGSGSLGVPGFSDSVSLTSFHGPLELKAGTETLDVGTDGGVTVSGAQSTATNALTRKDYVDDTTVSITGDTMTGNLTINPSGPSPILYIQPGTVGNGSQLVFNDIAGANMGGLFSNEANGQLLIKQRDGTADQTVLAISAGNVSLTGLVSAPTLDEHLTRKDYVDDNFYQSINGGAQTDLDLVITHGIYNFGAWLNIPVGAGAAGSLTVAARDNDDTSAKTQLYIDSSNKSFFRYGSGVAPFAWQAWKQVFTTDGASVMTGDLKVSHAGINTLTVESSDAQSQIYLTGNGILRLAMRTKASATGIELAVRNATGNIGTTYTLNESGHITTQSVTDPTSDDLTRKDYVDGTTVALDGSRTMTGNLNIGDGATGSNLYLRAPSAGNVHCWLRRSDQSNIGLLYADVTNETVSVRKYAANGSTVETDLVLQNNGNVSITASAPSAINHLTRKDYVDDNFLSSTVDILLGHHPEGRMGQNAFLSNDLANLRLRGGTFTLTQGYAQPNNANIDTMFSGKADFFNMTVASATFPIIMTMTLPKVLQYSATCGIGFGNSSWSCGDVKVEAFSEGIWKTVQDVTGNTAEDIYGQIPTNGAVGTTQIRITLDNPNQTSIRIPHIWGYDYDSDMWAQAMMEKAGGTMYGALTLEGNLTIATTSPDITLKSTAAGTNSLITFQDAASLNRAFIWRNDTSDILTLDVRNTGGTVTAAIYIRESGIIDCTGIVTSSVAPTADDHLTRKDYVDGQLNRTLTDGSTTGAGSANGITVILNAAGATALNTATTYIVQLVTRGTGTSSGAYYTVRYDGSWNLQAVSLNGNTSNHPLLVEIAGELVMYNNHATVYPIRAWVNSTYWGQVVINESVFGADATWQTFAGSAFISQNVSVTTAAPVDADHLTRKDYVDTLHANRNVIINGNMDVWQRGNSLGLLAHNSFSADRIGYGKNGTMVHSGARSVLSPTYAQSGTKGNYSLLLDCTTADTVIDAANYNFITYKVEGYDYARLAGGDATLSFWVYATKTGIHCVSFRNGGADRSYVAEYTVNTADTWEKKTITIPLTETGGTWDYTNGAGMVIAWALASGTTYHTTKDVWQTGNYLATSAQVNACDSTANNFRITQIQFERGSSATAFEFKPYADELNRCLRYFEVLEDGTSSFTPFGNLTATVTTSARGWVGFSRKRTSSYTFSHTGNFSLIGAASNAVTTITLDSNSDSSFRMVANVASGLVAGQSVYIAAATDSTARMYVDAEL